MRCYAGVGSRETPPEVLDTMHRIAEMLALKGWVLRSGGARGADLAFEAGCDAVSGKKEIFIAGDAPGPAYVIAKRIHPAWDRCGPIARKYHARNVCQVLGLDLNTPSEFVVCWTPGGQDVGGTRTAIVLARQHGIPVYNLALGDFPYSKWR